MIENKSNNNPIKRMSRRTRLFLKAFLVTTLFLSVVVVSGIIMWNRATAPPEIPAMRLIPMPPMAYSANPNNGSENGSELENPLEYAEPEYIWPAPEGFTDDDRRDMFWTILIVGLNEGRNANTIMVASYCGISREANLISIPRDVPVHPTRRGRKLSSSFLVGAGGGRGMAGGIAQVQRDVMSVIGFIPDYYVVIDYDTFFTIIDAVGGIEIYVPIRMRYDDPYQNLRIDIHPGFQHMDSATALHFVRFRQSNHNSPYPSLPDGDFGRIRNQQAVINAVINRLLRPATLLRIPELVGIYNESVYTNLTYRDMMFFGLELNHVRGTDALSMHTFLSTHTCRDNWYEFLDAAAVIELVNRTINPFTRDIELRDINIIRN